MFKKSVSMLLIVIFILIAAGLAFAMGDGNERKGKYLYRKNCRTCHSEGKEAKELSPVSKTQAEWQTAFAPEKIAAYPCKDKFGKLKEKDLNDIYTYLYKHAKDSPSPAKCK